MSILSSAAVLHFAQDAYPEAAVVDIEQLAQAGSDRVYYRIRNGAKRSIIACQSENVVENNRFIELANFFSHQGLAVPDILAVHPDRMLYLQSDAGGECLLDLVLKKGHTEEIKLLYSQALQELVMIQLCAKEARFQKIFDTLPSFGFEQILFDLRYFKNNFASKTEVPYDDKIVEKEFEALAKSLDSEKNFFMYRDCQGRNIMVDAGQVVFIDFQGGLKGHPMYDVASLLWQAKANIPADWKAAFVAEYIDHFAAHSKRYNLTIDKAQWLKDYEMLTLIRLMQVLGAYGLRGLVEGKEHFISSIPMGLENINEWLKENGLQKYPELMRVLNYIATEDFINKFR